MLLKQIKNSSCAKKKEIFNIIKAVTKTLKTKS